MTETRKKSMWSLIGWIAAIVGTVGFVLSVCLATIIVPPRVSPDWATSGTFGDTFGGTNALFSGLAFAALVFTLVLQKKELALQRTELTRSVDAQEASQQALREQVGQMRRTADAQVLATKIDSINQDLDRLSRKDQTPERDTRREGWIKERDELMQQLGRLIEFPGSGEGGEGTS